MVQPQIGVIWTSQIGRINHFYTIRRLQQQRPFGLGINNSISSPDTGMIELGLLRNQLQTQIFNDPIGVHATGPSELSTIRRYC